MTTVLLIFPKFIDHRWVLIDSLNDYIRIANRHANINDMKSSPADSWKSSTINPLAFTSPVGGTEG